MRSRRTLPRNNLVPFAACGLALSEKRQAASGEEMVAPMKRTLATALLLAWMGLIGTSALRAQDTIRYLDRKTAKEATSVVGTIVEESPAHVVYKPMGAASREIAATDIID